MASKLTVKCQVTVPQKVREHLGINPGDAIEFVVLDNGTVVVKPAYLDIMELDGILRRPNGKKLSTEEMNKIIKSRFSKR